MHEIVVIGGGPAGLTAALYARRSGKTVLVLEKEGFGGQITASSRVENYPGIPEISGAELAERMMEQVLALGADTDVGEAAGIRGEPGRLTVYTEEGEEYPCKAVILATGARHRMLGLAGEGELVGRGVSYCAVCDGEFYRGRDVAVAGGGDTALQEALLLADLCRTVYVIHRRPVFRGDALRQERLFSRPNVRRLAPGTVTGLLPQDGQLRAIRLREGSGPERELAVDALFVAVGLQPQNQAFAGVLALDGDGYALADEQGAGPVPGVFAAGDCRRKTVRQLTTAVADGACAALAACRFLDEAGPRK